MRQVGKSASEPSTDGPELESARVGIVVASWNEEITDALLEGAFSTLIKTGCKEEHLEVYRVPGSFELPYKAQRLLNEDRFDALICLGSLIRGETLHFELIAHSVANAVQELNLRFPVPTLFGVLTDDHMDQARARAGGEKGNKGSEAAEAAIQLIRSEKKD